MQKKIIIWLPAILWMAVISCLSNIPNLHLASDDWLSPASRQFIEQHVLQIGTNGFFSYQISLYPDFVLHKLGHIFLFWYVGTPFLFFLAGQEAGDFFVFLFAAIDEGHQFFVAGRSARLGDIMLDTLAGLLFIGLWVISNRLRAKR